MTQTPPPPPVSKHYKYDWQFAARLLQAPILKGAALTISIAPIVLSAVTQLNTLGISYEPPWQFWTMWTSSVLFLAAWALLAAFGPDFVKRYHSYMDYEAEKHSHRWVLWNLFLYLETLKARDALAAEFITKQLVEAEPSDWDKDVGSASPIPTPKLTLNTLIYRPVNIGRDLIVPIEYNLTRYYLTIRENDAELSKKEKEAFWILFTSSAKSKPLVRGLFWFLSVSAMALAALPLLWNLIRVTWLLLGAVGSCLTSMLSQ